MTGPAEVVAGARPRTENPQTGGHQPDALGDGARIGFHPKSISVDAGFFTWDIPSDEVVCDPIIHRMHGLPDDVPTTMDTFLSKVPRDELGQVRQAMAGMLAASGTYQLEYRIEAPDGALRSMEARGRIIAGPDGQPARMMGLVMDTTALRAKNEAEKRRLRELADRARRMRDFTAALASAVTVSAIVEAAEVGLRAYGADSMILVEARDGRLAVAVSCGLDDEVVEALCGLNSPRPAVISAAIQWGSPVYVSSPQILAEDYPHLAGALRNATQQAWVALPVHDSGGQVGACLFGFPRPQEFPPDERAQLFAASGLLAMSLQRARMYEVQRALAAELQHGMLPRGKLTAPGLTIATRYLAATSGIEIGGDFYDVVHLNDGRVALVIGDVEGHNLLAASLMGRLRTTVHAYAREGHSPAEVMTRANHWLVELNSDPDHALFATCCLIVVDPATRELAMCRAGHPPALLVTPGIRPRLLDCDAGLPLGVDVGAAYTTSRLRVAPGSLLVLTTDGLLETEAGDEYSLSALIGILRLGVPDDLEVLADDLLSNPRRKTRHSDDAALLLARLENGTDREASVARPADSHASRQADQSADRPGDHLNGMPGPSGSTASFPRPD
ncbi:MAG TPA: SpoIIE family protein phosphatase [Streptosporangiaceae bacterium]|nr:SpoIIE family protein phosphatase [Streptosporangiaceae bacterium]